MKKIIIGTVILLLFLPVVITSKISYVRAEEPQDKISHQQKVWIHALEWCESRGIKTAINPKDLDGTPSYYSFQFKPSTFAYYLKKYNIPQAEISDYDTQYLILTQMVNDKNVRWNREFPDCVKKLGYPPK